MESDIISGLTAALYGKITLDNGRVQQSNFHDHPLLRMTKMLVIAVPILPSTRLLAEWERPVCRPVHGWHGRARDIRRRSSSCGSVICGTGQGGQD